LGREPGAQCSVDPLAAGRFMQRPHRSDRRPLAKLDRVERAEGGQVAFELQGQFDGRNLGGVTVGEVGDIAFADPIAVALRLAEVDRLVDLAIGRGPGSAGDMHAYILWENCSISSEISPHLPIHCMSTFPARNHAPPHERSPVISNVQR
jgi:hypothetical protein